VSATEDLIRILASELVVGARAASLTITRVGDPGLIARDHEVVAIADGVTVTLTDVLDSPPQVVRAPAGALSWTGVAIRRELPVRIFAGRDWSGLLALFYDPASELDKAVTKTSLAGPQGRVAAALRQLGEDAGPVVASGVAGYLASTAALQDNGWPLRSWMIIEVDEAVHTVRVVAEEPDSRADRPTARGRRGAIFDAVLGTLERDAFGQGLQSPRAKATVGSLNVVDDDAGEMAGTLPGPTAFEPDRSIDHLDTISLLRGLPERDRTILERTADGWRDVEIADQLGLSVAAVRMARSRTRAALRKQLTG
jgi:DNA-binding CsgD family transcriptional regulator